MWERRDQAIPEAWYRLPIFYFSNVSELRGPGEPVWAPRGSVGAGLRAGGRGADRHAGDGPPRGARRGGDRRLLRRSTTGRRGTSSATRARSASGRRRARTSRSSIGPWLVTPDELADRRSPGATGPDLAMVATVRTHDGRDGRDHARDVVERRTTRSGRWSPAPRRTCACARASSSAAGPSAAAACSRSARRPSGRYLEPGDEVTLEIERLGRLVTPVVARPS